MRGITALYRLVIPIHTPRQRRAMALAAALALLGACSTEPRPLVAGQDACDVCRMTVSDTRFGGEVITRKGRIHTFDSVECLASYVNALPDSSGIDGAWVADYETSTMVPVARARFVRGGTLHSPMGRDLAAFAEGHDPAALTARYGGEVVTWNQVREEVAAQGMAPAAAGRGDSLHGAR